jgi:hypothetical protein
MWRLILRFRQRLGVWWYYTDRLPPSFVTAVFSVRLPATPVGAVPIATSPGQSVDPETLHATLQGVWERQVLASFQTIWAWRNGLADNDFTWTHLVVASALRGRLSGELHAAAISVLPTQPDAGALRRLLALCPPPPNQLQPRHHPYGLQKELLG